MVNLTAAIVVILAVILQAKLSCSQDCRNLTDPENGNVEVSGTFEGDTAVYSCIEGYELNENGTRTCGPSGTWSGEEPICIEIECDALTEPENGSIIIGPRIVGSLAIYICNVGYTLSVPPPAYRQCQANRTWSEVEPTCDPVDCGSLTDISNGSVNFTETIFGSIATYSCNEGFGIQGPSERVCEATGQWNRSEPSCRSECSDPCHLNAQCVESEVNMTMCVCRPGFTGNGLNCSDIDDCNPNPCNHPATCIDQVGSYLCICPEGFESDGVNSCTNINECDTIGCDSNAICVDSQGSFTCDCNDGFSGNGFSCQDINECGMPNNCSENAECTNTPGSFQCTCVDGYFGDGFNCKEQCSFSFQLLLEEILSCNSQWRFTNTALRLSQITEGLKEEINIQCMNRDSCLPQFYQNLEISNEEFSCSEGNHPLYRAFLRGQTNQSCIEVELILTEWIKSGSASVVVQGNRLSIADFCDIKIDSFTDPIACNEPTTEPRPTIITTVMVQADSGLSSEQMVGIAAGIAAFIVVVVIVASIVFLGIVLGIGLKSKKRKSHSHYFEHELASPDVTETVINNGNTATQSSTLRPTYSDFNAPDPTAVARMSTFNPQSDVIPTLIRSYSSNSLSRHRVHNVVMENQGAREHMDDEVDHDIENYPQYPSSPSP